MEHLPDEDAARGVALPNEVVVPLGLGIHHRGLVGFGSGGGIRVRFSGGGGGLDSSQFGDHGVPAGGGVLVGVALGLGGGHVVQGAEGMEHAHPAQHVVEPVVGLCRVASNVIDHLLVGLIVVLSLQVGEFGDHGIPAGSPELLGVVLGFGGGHVVQCAEGVQYSHPAQHVVGAVLRFIGVVPNVVDHLRVGLMGILSAGGIG